MRLLYPGEIVLAFRPLLENANQIEKRPVLVLYGDAACAIVCDVTSHPPDPQDPLHDYARFEIKGSYVQEGHLLTKSYAVPWTLYSLTHSSAFGRTVAQVSLNTSLMRNVVDSLQDMLLFGDSFQAPESPRQWTYLDPPPHPATHFYDPALTKFFVIGYERVETNGRCLGHALYKALELHPEGEWRDPWTKSRYRTLERYYHHPRHQRTKRLVQRV